jgi:hypothetical protein
LPTNVFLGIWLISSGVRLKLNVLKKRNTLKSCDYEQHIENVTDKTLQAFDENIANIPDTLCGGFQQATRDLEAQLVTIYRFVVSMVREEEMEIEAQLWTEMVSVCDKFSKKLEDLIEAHPTCGAAFYRDRILDMRNKCKRLAELHS